MKYTHRYLARIVLEAKTALFVGSGNQSLLNDALVQRDHHGLPMILGTSLAGVLRHSLEDHAGRKEKETWRSVFGYQEGQDGLGSKLRISSAYLVLPDGTVAEGLTPPPESVIRLFENLPVRQHVRINHRGAAIDKGLFDNEVVFKGCRFKFEMELRGDEKDAESWKQLLQSVYHPLFRIGQGTRKGYGQLCVTENSVYRIFDLTNETDFKDYLDLDPSLNAPARNFDPIKLESSDELIHYRLKLEPDQSFFIFGSGAADDRADQTPVEEDVLVYEENGFQCHEHTLIPGSSIKGALSHRTCFHYNRLCKIYADFVTESDHPDHTGVNNEAVRTIFGFEAKDNTGRRGRLIVNDLYYPDTDQKLFNHVAIDRFTGGAIDGALFSEQVVHRSEVILDLWLENYSYEKNIIEAFECALQDVCDGYLPLGGMTTKGHGIFKGTWTKYTTKNLEHV